MSRNDGNLSALVGRVKSEGAVNLLGDVDASFDEMRCLRNPNGLTLNVQFARLRFSPAIVGVLNLAETI